MKKLMTAALALSFVLMSTAAFAQPEPGDAGVFGDQAGTETTISGVVDFAPFNWYVIGFDLYNQVKAFEFGFFAPANLTILSLDLGGPAPGNIGTARNVIAFTGACADGSGAFVMGSYNGGFFAPGGAVDDITFCIGAATPSSFGGEGGGWSQCDNTLQVFGVAENGGSAYPNGCLVVNPTSTPPVAVENDSFGQVKARF